MFAVRKLRCSRLAISGMVTRCQYRHFDQSLQALWQSRHGSIHLKHALIIARAVGRLGASTVPHAQLLHPMLVHPSQCRPDIASFVVPAHPGAPLPQQLINPGNLVWRRHAVALNVWFSLAHGITAPHLHRNKPWRHDFPAHDMQIVDLFIIDPHAGMCDCIQYRLGQIVQIPAPAIGCVRPDAHR